MFNDVQSLFRYSFIYFTVVPNLEHRAPFGVSVITHTVRHTVGPLWTSDQPVAEASTYTGQHKIQETNIHAPSGIRTRDPSNQGAADLRIRPRVTRIGLFKYIPSQTSRLGTRAWFEPAIREFENSKVTVTWTGTLGQTAEMSVILGATLIHWWIK
jgi:hypothetical protein